MADEKTEDNAEEKPKKKGKLLIIIVVLVLLLGGGLALYLGFDELKDSWKKNDGDDAPVADDKDRIAELEKELADLKK